MKPEATSLFSNVHDFSIFLGIIILLIALSLTLEFRNYKSLTKFNDTVLDVTVLAQYIKHKNARTYQVLKLKAENGASFYTTANLDIRNLAGYKLSVWIKTDKINFLDYLKGFFTYSKIERVNRSKLLRYRISSYIGDMHESVVIKEIYGALFTATPMSKNLRVTLSALGINHLLAISGFHLGVLSILIFSIFKFPYRYVHSRYFPFRHGNRDLFMIVTLILAIYVIFLGMPPSLLRSFTMLLIGYFLYDRGVEVISMQTLLLTVLILLVLWPTLFFNIGFWLSVSGVFYIFIFLIHFRELENWIKFISINLWVYLMMLPIALTIFGTFSLLHPLSVLATMFFTIFYPLVLTLHFLGAGTLFDSILSYILEGVVNIQEVILLDELLFIHIFLSLLAIRYKNIVWLLLLFSIVLLISSIHQIA